MYDIYVESSFKDVPKLKAGKTEQNRGELHISTALCTDLVEAKDLL